VKLNDEHASMKTSEDTEDSVQPSEIALYIGGSKHNLRFESIFIINIHTCSTIIVVLNTCILVLKVILMLR